MNVKPNLKPLGDRVLILPVKKEKTGGIILLDDTNEMPQEGIVIAVGPGKKDHPTQLKPGDKVIYKKYTGTELKLHHDTYVVVHESDIPAQITE